jgi:hypothetical protein
MGIDRVMVERAQREPTMEEIVVALRETTRDADQVLPFAVTGSSPGKRIVTGINEPTDVVSLRDGEVERLLRENARLNARVVSLLKVLEHMQARHVESRVDQTAETTRTEADREAIPRAVRMALEAELGPILLLVLRLLERQRDNRGAGNRETTCGAGPAPAANPGPSGWLVHLMQGVEDKAPAPDDRVTAEYPMPRRSKLRELMVQVLNGLRPEPHADTPRHRYSPHDDPT